MTTINTSEDVLALLRENPEFREAARQLILTEELLALPAVFSGFASEMRSAVSSLEGRQGQLEEGQVRLEGRQERLEEGQVRLEGRQERLEEGQVRLEGRQERLEERQGRLEGRMERLEEGQGRLEGRQERLEIVIDSLRGTALEQRLSTRLLPLVGREFEVRRVFPIWSPGVIDVSGSTREFHDKVERALEEGVIDDEDDTRLRVTDLIIRSQRKSDRSTLWFAVEASGIINDDDIIRSRHSADIVNRIYGQDALPIVYGYRIREGQMRLAEELGVHVYIDPEGIG